MNILSLLSQYGPVLNSKTGEEKPLKDLPFKYLGVYFTATWCSYCWKIVDKMPNLLAAVNSRGSHFRLLTLRLDEDETNFGYSDLRFKSMNNEVASVIANALGVYHIPKILVYDYLGRLVSTNGFNDMNSYRENTI